MKSTRQTILLGFLCACALASVQPSSAFADEVKLNVTSPKAIEDTLESRIGKQVILKLTSGQEVEGKVGAVGPNTVQIAELKGMEFFDAIVRLDQIAVVVVRTR